MHSSNDDSIKGMTVNERLFHFGLLDQFGAALRSRDSAAATAILQQAKFTQEEAEFTVATTLATPERYGY